MPTRREKLEEMLKSSPDDPFLHYGIAMEDRTEGDLAAAADGLRKVIGLDGDYVAAYFHLGQVLAERGDAGAARQILQEGIGVAGRTGDAHAEGEMREFLETLGE
ncbi:MAG: hypothetical protein DWQ45_16825 [Planctomycetota bacterium]|nr:MAG: hypothetical protein DWQ29_10870 [Planctomycetota bacterium]REK21677.1 MAG: hypothetical protein DWQ41_20620 [Planctomycetota bacterium]REK32761.1 MAG: hypothetical protein DWQ45_16825 [Planctomycetota bacterium]